MNTVSYEAFLKAAEEKGAFIQALKNIAPVAGNAAKNAFGGAKNLLKDNWNSMSRLNKAFTVGLPAVTTLPGMFDKQDQFGRSRGERLGGMVGNIAGGMAGTQLGTKLSGALGGKGKFVSEMAGGMLGAGLGEKLTASPFKALKGKQQPQGYGLQQQSTPPQTTFPQTTSPNM